MLVMAAKGRLKEERCSSSQEPYLTPQLERLKSHSSPLLIGQISLQESCDTSKVSAADYDNAMSSTLRNAPIAHLPEENPGQLTVP